MRSVARNRFLTMNRGNQVLRALLNAIPMPVFYKDTSGRYIGVNHAFEAFYGKTDGEMVGKTVFDVAPPELADIYHRRDMEFFANPHLQVYESRLRDAYGEIHEVVFHKVPFWDSAGKLAGMIGVIIDITDRKRAEKEAERKAWRFCSRYPKLPYRLCPWTRYMPWFID